VATKRKWQRGKMSEQSEPVWEPLLELVPEDIGDFIWMGEAELTDGTRVQLYKHHLTRRYLHLDLGGRAFRYRESGRYEEVDLERDLAIVFGHQETRGDVVRRNEWLDDAEISLAPIALRYGIEEDRSVHVIRTAGVCLEQDPDRGYRWDEFHRPFFVFLGDDADGMRLEVVAVRRRDAGLLVVHAALLGGEWREDYWRLAEWPL
jgi:hypothetical protein